MEEPRFDKKLRYRDKKGRKFGKGVWLGYNRVIQPGWGDFDRNNRTVTQYNTDGTKTVFSWEQWENKKTKDHELKVLQNDRKYAIPFIPSKKITITIDNNSPTRKNAGTVISENLLDSIAVNASKAKLPFSTALGIVAQESTLGNNSSRAIGKSMLPWLYVLNNSKGKSKNAASSISYDNMQSPSLLISNWKRVYENPFAVYHYDSQGDLLKEKRDDNYYNNYFNSDLRKSNKYKMKDVSPLFHGFRVYKKDPYNYNYNDKDYPNKVEAQKNELVKYSPEIKAYMKKHNLHSDGGYLDNDEWDSLSYRDKAEMMKVAVSNGITTLPEIRKAYNEFAKGGKIKWTMQDEAGYKYWRSKLPKNLRETNDNDYDMRAAYKAGMTPQWSNEDKSYHLGSRDPQSGRILKAPHHPTFLKALITDASMGYYPTTDKEGHTYTETWRGNNIYSQGGYKPSSRLQQDIATWEGSEMKRNRPFSEMTQQFNAVVSKELQAKLQSNQLDALYSYGYNVGMDKLKERVLPTLTAYTQGKATREDVQRSMWATKDSQLRGLTKRRNWEREMFGGNYRTTFNNKNIGVHIDPTSLQLPQGFFDETNALVNVGIPQMQFPDTMNVDPTTLYKAPTIDDTLFVNPKTSTNGVNFNSQEDRIEGVKRFNTIMNMMGESTPFGGLISTNNEPGLLSYVNAIYNS